MIPSNFHTHTTFCDGKDTPEELVLRAIEFGCRELGFSGHSHSPFDSGYCMSPEGETEYRETVTALKEKYRDRIRIFLGIEQDYYSDLPDFRYDYVIGSVHYVKKGDTYISVDGSPEGLERGVQEFYGGDYRAFVEDYYKIVGDLYRKTGCNIIGHFDIVRKFNDDDCRFPTDAPWYRAAYLGALERLFAGDCAFEINTRGSAPPTERRNFPDAEIEAILRKNGRKILYTSDCHDKKFLLTALPIRYDNLANIPRLGE